MYSTWLVLWLASVRAASVDTLVADAVDAGNRAHGGRRSGGPHNFIFYQPDEMRAESLGCYGKHGLTKVSPNLDKFAAEGTRFEQAHTAHTVCTQSRVSFMTGWPTHVRGHRSLWSLMHKWEPQLLQRLKGAGYTVKWWGKNDLL